MSLLRLPAVVAAVGLRKSTIYAKIKEGEFPNPVKLTSRAVAWRKQDIERWIADLPATVTFDRQAESVNKTALTRKGASS